MIKGLDTGYMYTKDNNLNIFRSSYSEVNTSVTGAIKITIDGRTYYTGIGNTTVDVNKVHSDVTKVCTLTNLAMSEESVFQLVMGLPIKQYQEYKDSFIETILSYNNCEVIFRDKQRQIMIKDVRIFPQGAAAYYALNPTDSDYIIVDIGGLTIDVAYIEQIKGQPCVRKADTWYKGMLTLFSDVIEQVNNRYETTLDTEYAEKVLTKGLTVNGEKQDLSFLTPALKNYFNPILNELRINYPSKTTPLYLCGGGANLLYPILKQSFVDCTLINNGQFSNAIGYYKIGQMAFGGVMVGK